LNLGLGSGGAGLAITTFCLPSGTRSGYSCGFHFSAFLHFPLPFSPILASLSLVVGGWGIAFHGLASVRWRFAPGSASAKQVVYGRVDGMARLVPAFTAVAARVEFGIRNVVLLSCLRMEQRTASPYAVGREPAYPATRVDCRSLTPSVRPPRPSVRVHPRGKQLGEGSFPRLTWWPGSGGKAGSWQRWWWFVSGVGGDGGRERAYLAAKKRAACRADG